MMTTVIFLEVVVMGRLLFLDNDQKTRGQI